MCIQDDEGRHVLVQTLWFTPLHSTQIGEALGLLHVIDKIHDSRLANVNVTKLDVVINDISIIVTCALKNLMSNLDKGKQMMLFIL